MMSVQYNDDELRTRWQRVAPQMPFWLWLEAARAWDKEQFVYRDDIRVIKANKPIEEFVCPILETPLDYFAETETLPDTIMNSERIVLLTFDPEGGNPACGVGYGSKTRTLVWYVDYDEGGE